jgi:hypothetical protein
LQIGVLQLLQCDNSKAVISGPPPPGLKSNYENPFYVISFVFFFCFVCASQVDAAGQSVLGTSLRLQLESQRRLFRGHY